MFSYRPIRYCITLDAKHGLKFKLTEFGFCKNVSKKQKTGKNLRVKGFILHFLSSQMDPKFQFNSFHN